MSQPPSGVPASISEEAAKALAAALGAAALGAAGVPPGQAVGARIGQVRCPSCLTVHPVTVDGPWYGSLDDQCEAALRVVTAQCPDHATVTISSPPANRSSQ